MEVTPCDLRGGCLCSSGEHVHPRRRSLLVRMLAGIPRLKLSPAVSLRSVPISTPLAPFLHALLVRVRSALSLSQRASRSPRAEALNLPFLRRESVAPRDETAAGG